jgi:hypothetical protein
VLSKTQRLMCKRCVSAHGRPVYQGSMSPVLRIGFTLSNTGASATVFSCRIASQK